MTNTYFPEFELTIQDGTTVNLDWIKQQKSIVYVYPKDFTPGCTIEANDFAQLNEDFKACGYRIVGISPDSQDRHKRFCEKEGLPFDLISDPEHVLLKALGAYGEKKNYGKVYMGVIRSTFEVLEDGYIAQQWLNVKAKGHAARILREIS